MYSMYSTMPYPEMVGRSRREVSTRDATNARQFEHWQTNGRYLAADRPDVNKMPAFQDFMPIGARTTDRQYRNQPRYRGADELDKNHYFAKYDTAYDSLNTIRELQAAVYEDKGDDGVESSKLLRRNFDSRFLAEKELDRITQTRLVLRPSMDDIGKIYNSSVAAGNKK
jgi:hypothetical protein